MKKLSNDDYLVEVTLRVGVRRKDAQAVIALTELWEDDETEQDRVLTAVMDLAEQGLGKHHPLIQYNSGAAQRLANLKAFRDFATLGERPRRSGDRKPKPTIESPLTKKRNKGKKISLDAADRLFAGFQERLNRLPSFEEFGVDVPLVLLFGSYLRREPEVGDIDLVIFATPRANYDVRTKEMIEAGRSGNGIIDQLYGPEREVLQFLKNRSSWLALHELAEAALMENLAFKVVHCSPEFKPLVDKFERKELTGEKFLKATEDLGTKLRAGMFTRIRE